MNLNIGNKISLGFAFALAAMIAVGAVSRSNLVTLNDDAFWVTHTLEIESHMQGMRAGILRAESAARGYAVATDPAFRAIVASAYADTRNDFDALRSLVRDNPLQEARLDQIDPLLVRRHGELQHIIDSASISSSERSALVREGERVADQLNAITADMFADEKRLLGERQQKAALMADKTASVLVYGTLAAFLAIVAVGTALTRSITGPLAVLGEGAAKIGGGDYSHRVAVNSSGEVARLAMLFNRMAAQVEERQAALADQDWLKSSLAAFAALYQAQPDRGALCRAILAKIAELTPIRRSAIYLTPPEDGEQVLTVGASYAGDGMGTRWAPGVGLPGECWAQAKKIYVDELPDGYFKIGSALGEAAPECLLLLPALYENRVRAVLEVAAPRKLRPAESNLLERLSEGLGIVLATLEATERTQALLQRSQLLTASLQDQTDLLRRSELQLQEQQEELKQSNEELEQANSEMEETNAEMEEKVNLLAEQKRDMEHANHEIERSKTELQEKAKQLALSSKYKSDFLANMSHELRTPLNSLMILSKILADDGEKNLTPKQVQYAQTINSSGNDLLEMINEILDLARIEAGAVTIETSVVTIKELCDFIESSFRHLAADKKLEYTVTFETGLPEAFETDGRRLRQVLKNLLSNAFKFTQRGFVAVDVRREAPSNGGKEAGLVISVTDSGIGIPPEKQQLIFEAFQQADAGTSRKYGGTGLGLAISRELSTLLGGFLRVSSELGKGSTFTLTVPLVPPAISLPASRRTPEQVRQPQADSLPPIGEPVEEIDPIPDDRDSVKPGDRVLLIVEDDRTFAGLMIEFAREKKFKAVHTASARQGLSLAHKFAPSAITLDLRLPDGDGWLVLDRLKHDPRTRHIPIHVISIEDQRDRSLRQGAVSYLQKPVTKETLDEAFQQTIDFINRPIKNLLVVEDDPVQRSSLVDLIGNGDVKTEAVGTADEAFAALERKRFDCLVIDLGLPDMNGVDLIREIQRRLGRASPPIIVYTGRELSREEDTELRLISDSIVIKNVRSPERLLDETALFLHRVQSRMPPAKRMILEQAQKKDAVLAGRSALVVDDDVRNIFAITAALEEVGMGVEYAESGQAALDRLSKRGTIDVVLMDVMMPEMDGFEAIRRIRAKDRYKKLPIISVTAKAMPGDREKCLEAGASDYITKPVDIEQLRSLLRVWLYAR